MQQPTLILGAEPRVAVTIARSLSRRGIATIVATLSPRQPPLASRAIERFIHLPDMQRSPDIFVATLCDVIRVERCDMLMPTSDSALTAVMQHYTELESLLHIACPPPAVLVQVLQKDLTLDIAARIGIAVPTSYHISSVADLTGLRGRLHFPIVAKPRSKTARNNFKVRYLHSFEELASIFAEDQHVASEVLIQEYCPGDGVGVAVLMRKGQPVGLFQHRRLKELPSTGGVSVMAVAEAPEPALTEQAVSLLRALKWEGVAMVEFRRDADRRAVLMEVNGRYWGSLSLAVQAGMDFPLYQWQLAHRESPLVPTSYAVGMRWRWIAGDFARLHGMFTDPRPIGTPWQAPWKETRRFLLDCRPSIRDGLWSLRDPIPALAEFGRTVKSEVTADMKALVRKMAPRRVLDGYRLCQTLGPAAAAVYLKLRLLRALRIRRDRRRRLPLDVQSVLFVCHGNIIRSPLAAALLRRYLADRQGRGISVASAGLYAKPGHLADPRALTTARELGVFLDSHRAQPITPELLRKHDVIFVMDYLNEASLIARYPMARHNVFLLGSATGAESDPDEIADPYRGDLDRVRRCSSRLNACVRRLADLIASTAAVKERSDRRND